VDSPFEVLGVDPDADDAAVVDAYRRRVKETHPDQGGSASEFQAVKAAYERIQDGYEPETDEPALDDEDDEDDADDADDESRVEYLNYAVLDDYGWGLSDDDLFEKAAGADLDEEDYGQFSVHPDETLLEAAEAHGFTWPFACRGGACSNCAVLLTDGEMPPPTDHILPPELIDRGVRLSCSVTPTTDEAKVVYNVKHLPGVNELLLPATRFEKAVSDD
jgi:ferredoxin